MELCGSGYVIDYCMSAFRKSKETEAIYNYLADGLYALVNRNEQLTYERRLIEILHPVTKEEQEKIKEDNKGKAKKIVSKIRNKLRG